MILALFLIGCGSGKSIVIKSADSDRQAATVEVDETSWTVQVPEDAKQYFKQEWESLKTLEPDPNFALAHNQLGQAYLEKHMHGEAIGQPQKGVELCLKGWVRRDGGSGRNRLYLSLA